jgi:hypothetical protein
LTWSNGFSRGRGKRSALVEKNRGPWQRNDVRINFNEIFFGEKKMKRREEKRMVVLAFYFQNCPFWTCIKKINSFAFDAWSFILVHIWFTPSEAL